MCEDGSDGLRHVTVHWPVIHQRSGNPEQTQTQKGQSLGVQVSEGISPARLQCSKKEQSLGDNPGANGQPHRTIGVCDVW